MTAVSLFADIPTTGVVRESAAERLMTGTEFGDDLAFVDRMADHLRERGAALVLYPAWRPASAVRLTRLARLLLKTDRIAAVPIDLPPLALSLVADQLTFMSRHVRPGLLAGLAYELAGRVHSGAWVSSVARLEHIATGFGQHLSSYLPGSGFMVMVTPVRRVHKITPSRPVAEIVHRPMDPVLVFATDDGGDKGWLRGAYQPAVGAVSVTLVGDQPLSAEFWGSRRYLEYVAFSGHLHALNHAIQALSPRTCPWCGEVVTAKVCVFCSMVQPVADAPPRRPESSTIPQRPPHQTPRPQAPPSEPPRPHVPPELGLPLRSEVPPRPDGGPPLGRPDLPYASNGAELPSRHDTVTFPVRNR